MKSKVLQVISEFPEGPTPSCSTCIFGHEVHTNGICECGCSFIHNSYINMILKGKDPDTDGNHPLMLCNIYDFSKPKIKFMTEYDNP